MLIQVLRQATLIALLLCLATSVANAQFTTIINLPPDPNIGDNQAIGSDTQINLADGGTIGNSFTSGATNGSSTNIDINITGGTIGEDFNIYQGTILEMSGGIIEKNLTANPYTHSHIFGGAFGRGFNAVATSEVILYGGEFRIDGVLIDRLDHIGDDQPVQLKEGSVLSGTLQDGTPFAFSSYTSDSFAGSTLLVEAAVLPAIGPATIDVPTSPAPAGIRTGQTLTLNTGGVLPNNFAAGRGSEVIMNDGYIGTNYKSVAAQTTINGGKFRSMSIMEGSNLDITGGSGGNIQIVNNSTANISAHNITSLTLRNNSTATASVNWVREIDVTNNSSANIAATAPIDRAHIDFDSSLTITGGADIDSLSVNNGSTLNLTGGSVDSFSSYSDPYSAPYVVLNGIQNTVVLTDTTIGNNASSTLCNITTTNGSIGNGFDTYYSQINTSNTSIGTGFYSRYGDINLSGGVIGIGTTLLETNFSVSGMSIGDYFHAEDSTVDITNSTAGNDFRVWRNSHLTATNTTIGDGAWFRVSTVDMDGGAIGKYSLINNTTFNLSNSSIGSGASIYRGNHSYTNSSIGDNLTVDEATITLDGGTIGNNFTATSISTVNLVMGSIGDDMSISSTQSALVIEGGTIGDRLDTNNTAVRISGGSIGNDFRMQGRHLYMSDGSIGHNFAARGDLFISGGTIGENFTAEGATVYLAGGNLQEDFMQSPIGLYLNVFGTEFIVDGVDITESLPFNQETLVTMPTTSFSGLLADGSSYNFLMPSPGGLEPGVPGANHEPPPNTLRLIRVEPGNFNIFAYDNGPRIPDLSVDGADFLKWQRGLGNYLNPNDLSDWEANFGSPPSPATADIAFVPEPSTALLLLTALVLVSNRNQRI